MTGEVILKEKGLMMVEQRSLSVDFNCPSFMGSIAVVDWDPSMPFPEMASEIGCDTETELITDTDKCPPLVVAGFYDPLHQVCHIVSYEHVPDFVRQLKMRDIVIYFMNIGYDYRQLAEYGDNDAMVSMATDGRLIDISIRAHLHELATRGYIRHTLHALVGITKTLIDYDMDKGDGTETSDRLSFRRTVPVTDSQKKYLAIDCICTYLDAKAVPKMPTEDTHSKGAIVLSYIEANGFCLDKQVYEALESELRIEREKARKALLTFGFPDPEKTKGPDDWAILEEAWRPTAVTMLKAAGIEPEAMALDVPNKAQCWRLLIYLQALSEEGREEERAQYVAFILATPDKGLTKKEKQFKEYTMDKYELGAYDSCSKRVLWPTFVHEVMRALNTGVDFDAAIAAAEEVLQDHEDWLDGRSATIGPRKYIQQHLKVLLDANPGLVLPMTPKSGDLKMTQKDKWRLEDRGIQDPFLEAHVEYFHLRKYMTTYLNRDKICSDWRIRPRFTNIMRTGRTSCSKPLKKQIKGIQQATAAVHTAFKCLKSLSG